MAALPFFFSFSCVVLANTHLVAAGVAAIVTFSFPSFVSSYNTINDECT